MDDGCPDTRTHFPLVGLGVTEALAGEAPTGATTPYVGVPGWRPTRTIRITLPDDYASVLERSPSPLKTALFVLALQVAEEDPERLRQTYDQVVAARDLAGIKRTR